MEDMQLTDAIERYLSGKMLPDEKSFFEQLRKNTPEIDQMVVEHKLFLNQIEDYSERRNLKTILNETHHKLVRNGDVYEGGELPVKGRVIQLWNKYKRVTAIAASIAGLTAVVISGLITYFSPAVNNNQQLLQLSGDIEKIKRVQLYQGSKINELNNSIPNNLKVVSSGTGFLVDGKGYLITSAHVLKGSGAVVVNNKGEEFNAVIINIDQEKDLAILKIQDKDFKPLGQLPYTIKKTNVDLGEELFTLGYPREQIVYNMGYLSAESGYNDDTSSYQISLSANPGNSGGPVFNKNGEIVGIVNSRQRSAEGVIFAIKAEGIYQMINALKESDTSVQKIKLPSSATTLKGKSRPVQIKEVEDYVFLVKAYNQQ